MGIDLGIEQYPMAYLLYSFFAYDDPVVLLAIECPPRRKSSASMMPERVVEIEQDHSFFLRSLLVKNLSPRLSP